MKLSEAFEAYENQKIIARNLSMNTLEGYKNTCSSFCSYFGDIKISKIGPDEIRRYYCDKLADHASDTIRGQIIQLRAVIKFCHDKGEKTCDPTYITIPKREKKSPKWLDRQDVSRAQCSRVRGRGTDRANGTSEQRHPTRASVHSTHATP